MRSVLKFVAASVVSASVSGLVVFLYMTNSIGGVSSNQSQQLGAGGLPLCRNANGRIPVRVWAPKLSDDGKLAEGPPQKDGQVVYIELSDDNSNISCAGAQADKLYSIPRPFPKVGGLDGGGLAVNLRGNVQFHNGFCTFKGFFMNQDVMGMHQGWVETYFKPLDQFDVVKSGMFCAE